MNQALKTVLPVKEKIRPVEKKTIRTELSQEELKELCREARRKHYRARERLFSALLDMEEVPYELAVRQLRLTGCGAEAHGRKGLDPGGPGGGIQKSGFSRGEAGRKR